MADKFVTIGLLGAAGYLAYEFFLKPATTAAATSATGTVSAPQAPAATPATLPASADALYQKMVAAANAAGVTSTGPDGWNVYLVAAGGPNPAPDPTAVFPDRSANLTSAQYWALMAPYLVAHGGLTGLGMYGSLGCLCGRRG